MANDFVTVLDSQSSVGITLAPLNLGNEFLYLALYPDVTTYPMSPTQKLRAVVIPSGHGLSDTVISGMLRDENTTDEYDSGIYYQQNKNNSSDVRYLYLNTIKIDNISYENTIYDVYWLNSLGDAHIFGSNNTGYYTFPHNIQPHEVSMSGTLISDSTNLQYTVVFNNITNENSITYSGAANDPPDAPYYAHVTYLHLDEDETYVSGQIGSGIYYDAGNAGSGITFNLPFYDLRPPAPTTPAVYKLQINNNSASSTKPGSTPLDITLDHSSMSNGSTSVGSFIKDLDSLASSTPNIKNIKKIEEDVYIEPDVIDRRRLSIRIEDVAIRENTYKRIGTFISEYTNLDYNMYTFSIRVKEFIPEYPDINKYDTIKYFIEFNNNEWEQISPINRSTEVFSTSKFIPKLFVFDLPPDESDLGSVKYLNYISATNSFRIKIEFDLSSIKEAKFTPPEVMGYRAIIFDKAQFLDL